MALSDLGSTVGSIPVDPSGQAILYDLCEDLSRTHDDEEKRAPQWHCSDILCKLPGNWLSSVKATLLSLLENDSCIHSCVRQLYEESCECLSTAANPNYPFPTDLSELLRRPGNVDNLRTLHRGYICPCAVNGTCTRRLCVLWQTAAHSSTIRSVLRTIQTIHALIAKHDMIALAIRHAKCFDQIERVLKMAGCQTDDQGTEVRSPVNEEALLLKFVKPMSAFRKAIHNVPVIPCVSCSLLLRHTDVPPFDCSEHVYVAPGSVG